jgi:hypothetical protein
MPKPELYKEYPQPNEEALITELIGILERLIEKPFLTGTTYRDTHAKGHATARAIFKIEDDLPADLQVGAMLPTRRSTKSWPGWILARSRNHASRGMIQRMDAGSALFLSSHRQASIPVLPAPITTKLSCA